jgi:hypothetical protein
VVSDNNDALGRRDFCLTCWENWAGKSSPDVLAVWKAQAPQPKQKKRLFVDDELIINFFERLAEAQEPVKIDLRFVLALVLMRKKLLVYDGSDKQDGCEVWRMHLKGTDRTHRVIDPHMDQDRIAEVSKQLSEVLEGEL